MKTHLELYGWEVRRAVVSSDQHDAGRQFVHSGEAWFNLWQRGGRFPVAGGTLPFIAKQLERL